MASDDIEDIKKLEQEIIELKSRKENLLRWE